MTEDLPLPPEVRAIQADVLRPLVFGWPCDAEKPVVCDEPAHRGGRAKCCGCVYLLCERHEKLLLAEFAGANLAGTPMACPGCHKVYPSPVLPRDMFPHHFNLTTGGTA